MCDDSIISDSITFPICWLARVCGWGPICVLGFEYVCRADSRLAPSQWETSLQNSRLSLVGRKPRISPVSVCGSVCVFESLCGSMSVTLLFWVYLYLKVCMYHPSSASSSGFILRPHCLRHSAAASPRGCLVWEHAYKWSGECVDQHERHLW